MVIHLAKGVGRNRGSQLVAWFVFIWRRSGPTVGAKNALNVFSAVEDIAVPILMGRAQILAKNVGNKRNLAIARRATTVFLRKRTRRRKYIWLWHAIENCNKDSILITRAESSKIGLKETEESKACTRLIRRKLYELVHFLQSYDVNWVKSG